MATTDSFTLTAEEAFSFLSKVLCMTSPESKLEANRGAFIDELLKAMHHHMPYHTLISLSTPHKERHLPTASEIKHDMFTKMGGRCYVQNVYGLMLLRAFDFEVNLVPSNVIGLPDVHTVLIVNNLTVEGSKHIVDFGSGCPTFRVIPLDFEEMSPEYRDSYLRYRFVRQGDVVVRQHTLETDRDYTEKFTEYVKDGWFSFFFIKVERAVDVAHFAPTIGKMYTVVDSGAPFLSSMRCVAFPHGRFVCIKDTTLLLENEEGRVQKSYFRSRDEILAAFGLYFPQFPEEMIKAAMEDENVTLDFNKKLK